MPSGSGGEPATQVDIAKLDQKIDRVESGLKSDIAKLDRKIDGVAAGLVKTQGDMLRMEERLRDEVRQGRRETNERIDAFLNKIETYARESVLVPKTLDAHGKTLRNHEDRLKAVETSARP